jgi:hypothetical protein
VGGGDAADEAGVGVGVSDDLMGGSMSTTVAS